MVKRLNDAILEVVSCIVNSDDYQQCLKLKKMMDQNEEILSLINEIKVLQKKYICCLDDSIQEKLKLLEERLFQIPLYAIYLKHLEVVNQKIDYVKDELNDYFYHVLNDGISEFE